MRTKYIRTSESGILIFPHHITHKEFASRFKDEKLISAGFVNMQSLECFGESISLHIKSNPVDSNDLYFQVYGYNK